MAQKPVPRAPGEALKLVAFQAPVSLGEAIEAKAAEAGLSKSDWLRALVIREVAA